MDHGDHFVNTSTAALSLVLGGVIFLVGGFDAGRQVLRQTTQKLGWGFLLLLIGLSLAAYTAFAYQLATRPISPVLIMVSLVFFCGAVFVFIITRLFLATLAESKQFSTPEAEKRAVEARNSEIRSTPSRLELILDNIGAGILVANDDGIIEILNPAAERLFGFNKAELLGKHVSILISMHGDSPNEQSEAPLGRDIRRFVGRESEVNGRRRDGTRFPMALTVESLILDGRTFYTALMTDISEPKALLDRLKIMAERDSLTGLYNRRFFVEQLAQVIQRIRRSKQAAALLHVDLDHFKYVNDVLGHAAGDRILGDVAQLLTKRVRKTDFVARLGGDEFIVLLNDADPIYAQRVAESFRTTLSSYRFSHNETFVDTGCSIGVVLIDDSCETEAQALSQADIACQLAKRSGRNRVYIFEAKDGLSAKTVALDMGWSHRIKEALSSNRFALFAQPIVSIKTGQTIMHEVLLRLGDSNGSFISAGGFLPAAQRFGLSVDIDKWMITNAISTLAEQRKTTPALRYSINLSGQSLADESVYRLIANRLSRCAVDPAALTFEITESVAICDMVAAENFLTKLRRLGCRTALDDFGSGFSSFTYLKVMPVDYVKIDGSFVKNLTGSRIDHAMIKSINEIAHVLGKETVAEFVESEAVAQSLRGHGVDYAQGHYFGSPELIILEPSAYSAPTQSASDQTDQARSAQQ